eukprot:TRINITY_DN52396_c0_g1_i1.p1 TRINITY_DN52396_c0_g1~~TRINITY_DN52396_c0_g1_i1.p1  ORF type:complete len:287 (+),score=119.26 TRINITY_DN52396_c0_g1_i1:87-863(+)
MTKSQYDTDITIWSPEGRLHQIEYAMEAVKKGSAAVGVKSATHCVLTALKRSPQAELASYQNKVFKLDPRVGMGIAGLTSDARYLAHFMRTECMNHRYVFDSMMPCARLIDMVADKHQSNTQIAGRRPYGVGCIIAGVDATGTHLYQTCPSGNWYDYKAIAIGHRSQSARTYLERHYESFTKAPLDELVNHALKALATTCGEGTELKPENTTIAIVGLDQDFVAYNDDEAKKWLDVFRMDPADMPAEEEGGGDGMATD